MEHRKGHTSQSSTHTFEFFTPAETALSDHAGLLMSVVTKTSEIENRDQRREIESVSWPWKKSLLKYKWPAKSSELNIVCANSGGVCVVSSNDSAPFLWPMLLFVVRSAATRWRSGVAILISNTRECWCRILQICCWKLTVGVLFIFKTQEK